MEGATMATYTTTKGRLFQQRSRSNSNTISGVPLKDSPIKGWKALLPCLCVMEPCNCDELLDDIIAWLPAASREEPTGKRAGSDEVVSYGVQPAEKILVEVQIPLTLAQLKKLKEWATRDGEPRGRSESIVTARALSVKDALLGAFAVGYALGEAIDEGTGLSDTISDWAAEHIPWPW
jgi:hypothetical protein